MFPKKHSLGVCLLLCFDGEFPLAAHFMVAGKNKLEYIVLPDNLRIAIRADTIGKRTNAKARVNRRLLLAQVEFTGGCR